MPDRPNVVVLVLDSVRADVLSCYAGGDLTPNIDAIARDGLRFENAFAPATWTVPSHASLFTGAYPSEHGTDKGTRYLNPSYTTLAERLRGAGYETVLYSNNVHLTHEFGFDRGFDVAETSHAVSADEDVIDWNAFIDGRDYDSGPRKYLEIVGHVLANRDKDLVRSLRQATELKYNHHFGDNGARASNRFLTERSFDDPYFLLVNYMEAHNPFEPPSGYADTDTDTDADPDPPDVVGWQYDSGLTDLSDDEIGTLWDLYRGEVAYLDERIGEIYAELDDGNTVVIVTADHGVSIGEHGHLYHGTGLYNPVTKVPLIVTGTGRTGRVPHSVGVLGLYRTACSLAGVDPDQGVATPVRGVDPLSVGSDRTVFTERRGQSEGIVEGRHKYVREYDPDTGAWLGDGELYDYVADPDETTRADDGDVRARMCGALDSVVDSLDPRENRGDVDHLDDGVIDRFEELGYIT